MPIRDEDGHRAMQAAGKAWKAIKTSGAKTWREWTEVIGPGLVNARAEAQSISNASSGKGYNAAMGALLEEYGFGNALERHRSQVTRADLLRCMDYLSEIEKWRHDAKASFRATMTLTIKITLEPVISARVSPVGQPGGDIVGSALRWQSLPVHVRLLDIGWTPATSLSLSN